jgi:hypothetical protein
MAIYRRLLELVDSSHRTKPAPGATGQQLAAWFDDRDQNEDETMRVRPALLATLRLRLMEHQKLTGHKVPWPIPPGSLTNPN